MSRIEIMLPDVERRSPAITTPPRHDAATMVVACGISSTTGVARVSRRPGSSSGAYFATNWVNDELPISVKRLSLNPAGRSLNDATRLPPKQRSDRATLLILVCCLHFPRSAQREPSTTGTDVTGETYVNFVAMTRPSSDESSRVTPVVR